MAKEYKITSLRLADLEKELNYLKTTREREIAAMIAEARSYGDLSENSEYDAAKNEQAKLYGRIAEIEDILSHATIIEDENEATGRVAWAAPWWWRMNRASGLPIASPAPRRPIPWSSSSPTTPPLAGPWWARPPVKASSSTLPPVPSP